MTYTFDDQITGGKLLLDHQNPELKRFAIAEKNRPLLTIAWNRGAAQTVYVDEVAYELEAGGVILLIYEHTYRFERAEEIVAWRFNRDFYCIITHDAEVSCVGLIFYGLPSPMRLTLTKDEQRKLDLLFQVFVDEFGYTDNIQGEMLRMLLKRLVILLTRMARNQHLQNQPGKEDVDLIREFNLLVEKNYAQKHQVTDYAELLFKSPKTLSNIFGKHSDKTPLQIIRERISLEAKRRLLYTDEAISEIGYELGYTEGAHFSRFFKKMEGVSPKQFRENSKVGKNR
ncbi:AraC family transcriptional regulator [Lewinellaceae bacterium SD302]|nr:AraC family transcriptional regulator [Lewinellaceae bacterium SD302]